MTDQEIMYLSVIVGFLLVLFVGLYIITKFGSKICEDCELEHKCWECMRDEHRD